VSLPAGPECVVLGARPIKRFTQNSAFLLPNYQSCKTGRAKIATHAREFRIPNWRGALCHNKLANPSTRLEESADEKSQRNTLAGFFQYARATFCMP